MTSVIGSPVGAVQPTCRPAFGLSAGSGRHLTRFFQSYFRLTRSRALGVIVVFVIAVALAARCWAAQQAEGPFRQCPVLIERTCSTRADRA